jgi:hypothetical protein
MATASQTEEDDGEAFMRSITWCWEDLNFVWRREHRWFRSPNIVALVRYRPAGWKRGDAL